MNEEQKERRRNWIFAYDELIKENNHTIVRLKTIIKDIEERNKNLDRYQHLMMFEKHKDGPL